MIAKRLRRLLGDELLARLLRGGAAALLIKTASAGLSFLMFLLLARAAGAEAFGRFGFAFSLAGMLGVVGSFGQRMMVLRYAPAYMSDGDTRRLIGVFRFGYGLVLAGCLLTGGGLAAVALLWPGAEPRGHLFMGALLTLAMGFSEYQQRALRAVAGMTLALAPRDVVWRALVALVAGAWLLSDLPPMTAMEGLAILAGLLLGVLVGQALMHPLLRPRALLLAPASYELREWRRASLGLWGVSVVQLAGPNVAVVVVGLVLAPERTAQFFAAMRVAMLLDLVTLAAQMVSAAMISRRWHRGDRAGVQRICRLVSLGATGPALAAFAVFVLFGDRLMAFFGPGFAEARWVLVILSLGYLAKAGFGPAAMLLQLAGRERALMRLSLISNTASIGAIIVLTPLFGALGAALGAAGGMAAWTLLAQLDADRNLGVGTSIFGAIGARGPASAQPKP